MSPRYAALDKGRGRGRKVTLRTDPFEPRLPGFPWDRGLGSFLGGSWLPAEKIAWVEKGEPLLTAFYNEERKWEEAKRWLEGAYEIAPSAPAVPPLIRKTLS